MRRGTLLPSLLQVICKAEPYSMFSWHHLNGQNNVSNRPIVWRCLASISFEPSLVGHGFQDIALVLELETLRVSNFVQDTIVVGVSFGKPDCVLSLCLRRCLGIMTVKQVSIVEQVHAVSTPLIHEHRPGACLFRR